MPLPKFRFDYVSSPSFDTVFFLAPFWVSGLYIALLYAFPSYEAAIFLISYMVLTETHFASTWTVYLDPKNREYYGKFPWIYYYIPLAIIVACIGLSLAVSLKFTIFFTSLASAIHVTRQSTGIVALYRGKAKQFDPLDKRNENFALYFASASFLGFGFERFYLSDTYVGISEFLPSAIFSLISLAVPVAIWGSAALAVWFIGCVVKREARRIRAGEVVAVNKLLALAYSLLLYSPYVFATRLEHAAAIGVGIHYVQYLGIVWLLNRNKYPETADQKPIGLRLLALLSQHWQYRLPYLLTYGGIMLLLRQQGFNFARLEIESWVYSIPLALQATHYHIDAFLWRFSNPFVRESVLPYIRRASK